MRIAPLHLIFYRRLGLALVLAMTPVAALADSPPPAVPSSTGFPVITITTAPSTLAISTTTRKATPRPGARSRRSPSTGSIKFSTAAVFTPMPCPTISTTPITVSRPPPLDVLQGKISDVFVAPIAWVDSFFFTEREEAETNRSYLRVITGYEWANGDGLQFRRKIRAKVRVPGVKERMHIIFDDDDDFDLDQTVAPNQGGTLTRRPINQQDLINKRRRAGVGYILFNTLNSTRVEVETALRSRLRSEISLRVRQKILISEKSKGRLSLNGFWLEGTGFGSRGRLDFERTISKRSIVREENSVTQIHNVDGVVIDNRLSFETQLNAKAGISPGLGFSSNTRPVLRAAALNATVLYRQNFFREWLFYELEPGINWTRNEFGAYPPIPTAAVRLEVQFRTSEP